MGLLEQWVLRCFRALISEPDLYVQIRKMFQNTDFICDWGTFSKGELPSFPSMGYQDDKSKMKQLERNYFNEEELIRLRKTFLKRYQSKGNKSIQSCVSARMGNKEKDSRSQGFCMQTLTINYMKTGKEEYSLILELHYRTTELTQKFLADLVFLRERVFPFIMEGWPEELKPTEVRFNFSTCYISLMFLPVLVQHTKFYPLLTTLKKMDKKYYRQVISATGKWFNSDCTYNYRTRAIMHNLFHERVYDKISKSDKEAIRQLLKEAGK